MCKLEKVKNFMKSHSNVYECSSDQTQGEMESEVVGNCRCTCDSRRLVEVRHRFDQSCRRVKRKRDTHLRRDHSRTGQLVCQQKC